LFQGSEILNQGLPLINLTCLVVEPNSATASARRPHPRRRERPIRPQGRQFSITRIKPEQRIKRANAAVDAAGKAYVAWLDNQDSWNITQYEYDHRLRTTTISNTIQPQITKHYYAPSSGSGQGTGQRVASRVDDALYYALNEPTGLGTVFVDDTGTEAGHIIYDAMDNVVEISAELPASLMGHLDLTGLQWDGSRYYDPATGQYLQPNSLSGPPTVPQVLNRYAATSVGQPGVAEAFLSRRWLCPPP
jgi:hypothetical protein